MAMIQMDVTRDELALLHRLTQHHQGELERMMQGLEEGEGMDLQRHEALKRLRPQVETATDLVMKLDGHLRA